MRPPNIRRAVTAYCRWRDPVTGFITPLRRVLANCVWMEQGNTVARQTGIALSESVFIQCFLEPGMLYVPLHAWNGLLETEGKWTVDILKPQTIIVDHVTDHEFLPGTPAQVTTAENDWLREMPGSKRVVSMEDNRRGTARAQHVLLRA